jgi:flagellin-like hook-associated protein FlgL
MGASGGQTVDVPSSYDAVKVLDAAITGGLNAQEVDAACIAADIQVDIDALEKEITRHRGAIPARHPERQRRVASVRKAERARLEELQSQLEDAKYALAVVNSPTLNILPSEVMAEILDWHMLMGGD